MIIELSTKAYQTCSATPNTNTMASDSNIVLLKEFAEDEGGNILYDNPNPLTQIVIDNAPYIEIIHENGVVTDILPLEKPQQEITPPTQAEIIAELSRIAIKQQQAISRQNELISMLNNN